MNLQVHNERFRLSKPFTIARGSRTHADVLVVTISDRGATGRGECVPYLRYGETPHSVQAQIHSVRPALERGIDCQSLQSLLPPGAARNALDCALWDLAAKQRQIPVWRLAGLGRPDAVISAYTLGLDTPGRMRDAAQAASNRPVLKIKLGGGRDLDRVRAVREGAPASRLVVDVNEAWDIATYMELSPTLCQLGVSCIEQPLPASDDTALHGVDRPVTLCADESCHTRESLPDLVGRYDMVNIKLDKAGGFTEALGLLKSARRMGFKVMVGCMVGSSLAIAPAVLLAQDADLIDLDAPMLLAEDRDFSLRHDGSVLYPPTFNLWSF